MQNVREWYTYMHTHTCTHTSGSALLRTRHLAGAVEEGVAGYANLGASYMSLKQGWVEARPQQ